MRNAWCLERIDSIIENCGLDDRTCRELRQVMKFRAENGALAPLANKAMLPIISVQDPETREKAISAVVEALGTKGEGKRLTAKEVKSIVHRIKGPQEAKTPEPQQVEEQVEQEPEQPEPVTAPKPKKPPIEAIQEAIETLVDEGLGSDQVKEILREAFNYVFVRVSQEQPTAQVASATTIPELAEVSKVALADRMVANYVTAKAVPKKVHKKKRAARVKAVPTAATSIAETKTTPLGPVVAEALVAPATKECGAACSRAVAMIGRW